jgi:nitrite reductase (NADH) small subunit
MPEFIEVAKTNDLPIGRATVRTIGDRRIALYHTATGFYASDNTCPHRGGPLGEGDIIGNEIVCPWHLWSFEIETGTCFGNPDIRITMHEVLVDGDRVLVRLP